MKRRRRPDDGRFLPKDAQTWRRLIKAVARAVGDPARWGVDVAAKADRAVRAVAPPGYAHRESVFLQLVVKARLFWPATAERQAEVGPELARLAGLCGEALAKAEAGPAVAERVDVFG